MSRRFLLALLVPLVLGACARAAAPLPPRPAISPHAETQAAEAAFFDALDNADRLRCADTVEVVVEVWQGRKMRPLSGLELSVSPGERTARTDAEGRASLGRLPAGDYRLALTDPAFALLETRPLPTAQKDRLSFRVTVEELGAGMPEVVVHGSKFRWCGALGEVCGVPMANKDRLHVVVDGFLRGLPH